MFLSDGRQANLFCKLFDSISAEVLMSFNQIYLVYAYSEIYLRHAGASQTSPHRHQIYQMPHKLPSVSLTKFSFDSMRAKCSRKNLIFGSE